MPHVTEICLFAAAFVAAFTFGPSLTLYSLYFQLRPDIARPINGITNPVVRRAIYHAVDRSQLRRFGGPQSATPAFKAG